AQGWHVSVVWRYLECLGGRVPVLSGLQRGPAGLPGPDQTQTRLVILRVPHGRFDSPQLRCQPIALNQVRTFHLLPGRSTVYGPNGSQPLLYVRIIGTLLGDRHSAWAVPAVAPIGLVRTRLPTIQLPVAARAEQHARQPTGFYIRGPGSLIHPGQ